MYALLFEFIELAHLRADGRCKIVFEFSNLTHTRYGEIIRLILNLRTHMAPKKMTSYSVLYSHYCLDHAEKLISRAAVT